MLGLMMLNPPTLVEHNNEFDMNGTNLRCSPPRSSNQLFNIKNGVDSPREDLGIK